VRFASSLAAAVLGNRAFRVIDCEAIGGLGGLGKRGLFEFFHGSWCSEMEFGDVLLKSKRVIPQLAKSLCESSPVPTEVDA
jgi:hypothetical protein